MCEACFERSDGGLADAPHRPAPAASRRGFLLLGLGLLAGCAGPRVVSPAPRSLPPVPNGPPPPPPPDPQREAIAEGPGASNRAPTRSPWGRAVVPRSTWAKGDPVPARMNRMTPIRHITIHHDGMDPFYATEVRSVADHLETIRRLHRRKGWADIGYHFAVDRAGRVWEARPLSFQGAHVKDHNPGNVGIVVLGNFELQVPTQVQLSAVQGHVSVLMRTFRVPVQRVQTHQEWRGAATACPGGTLQRSLDQLRLSGGLG